jgi:hypothetical protein
MNILKILHLILRSGRDLIPLLKILLLLHCLNPRSKNLIFSENFLLGENFSISENNINCDEVAKVV